MRNDIFVITEFLDFNSQSAQHSFIMMTTQELARLIRPNSLRALYGRTKAKNAIHCTDLLDDALLEVEYFFKILDQ